MKRGFTLVEVTMAIGIMAGGMLAVIALFCLGFRENRQAVQDVASSTYANAVMDRLVNAITATNLSWKVFRELKSYPDGVDETGWIYTYIQPNGNGYDVKDRIDDIASKAFGDFMEELKGAAIGEFDGIDEYPDEVSGGMKAGLIIQHDNPENGGPDPTLVRITFRAAKDPNEFISSPIYYTEARFQGIPNK